MIRDQRSKLILLAAMILPTKLPISQQTFEFQQLSVSRIGDLVTGNGITNTYGEVWTLAETRLKL